jgi:glycosyltransferase EpsD
MFLRAAARVLSGVPNARFIIAGEGELMDDLGSLASELGVAEETFFIGRCDDVAELLMVSNVCVLTSKAEGFSNSILEYMAAARPVVATDVGGAREAIAEGESGYIVASDDDEALAERVTELLRNDEKARAMGVRGRQIVEEKFSDKAQLKNTEAMYDLLLHRVLRSPG